MLIEGLAYSVAEHPSAPGMPYGQEGRQATVYQLVSGSERRALKVFKPRYCSPSLVGLADRLSSFASLAGLAVCERTVLSPMKHQALLKDHPDLTYAVLMPWVEGPTWMEVMVEKREMTQQQSLQLARGLASVLVGMEERGIAHCDLSAPNVILPCLAPSYDGAQPPVSLVDVEQMYGPGLDRPEALPGGSPGYAHPTAASGLWEARADRFAGAVLIGEMLGRCDERVRTAAWGESYFEPSEMGRDCERARLLEAVLNEVWGKRISSLFARAWHSPTLADCPPLGRWLVAMPERTQEQETTEPEHNLGLLILRARGLEDTGDLEGAAAAYQQVRERTPSDDALHKEVDLILQRIRERLERQRTAREKVLDAGRFESEGRWREAALIYEGLLEGSSASPGDRTFWQEALVRATEEAELAELFDTADRLIAEQRSPAAAEILTEILRRRPGYSRKGRTAPSLLDEARAELPRRRLGLSMGILAGPLVALAVMAALAAFVVLPNLVAGSSQRAAGPSTRSALSAVSLVGTPTAPAGGVAYPTPQPISGSTEAAAPAAASPTPSPATPSTSTPASPTARPLPPTATTGPPTGTPVPPTETAVPATATAPSVQTPAPPTAAPIRLEEWRQVRRLTGHTGPVTQVVFSPNGRQLLSGSDDQTARLWDVASGSALATLDGHSWKVMTVAISTDGGIAASAGWEIKTWALPAGTLLGSMAMSGSGSCRSAAFIPGTRTLACALNETVELLDVNTGRTARTIGGMSPQLSQLAVSPDGRLIATSSQQPQIVELWEVTSGQKVRTLGPKTWMTGLSFSPDSRSLATGGGDCVVRVWDVDSGRETLSMSGHRNWVTTVAFSPDGRTLASGDGGGVVNLWDARSGLQKASIAVGQRVQSVAFSPDGSTLAIGSSDNAIGLWTQR